MAYFVCMSQKEISPSEDEDLRKLGERIKALRIKAGYANYEKFANAHDLARAQYGRYEAGENLQYKSLLKVMKALNVTPKEFFSEGFD